MAKIHEEIVLIKLSKLIKDDQQCNNGTVATDDIVAALQSVAQELVGDSALVEADRA